MVHLEATPPQETLDPDDWESTRALGHRMVDDMVDYLKTVRDRPPWQHAPERVRAHFDGPLPLDPQPLGEVYEDFLENVLPYPVGNTHPRFWGWVIGTGTVSGAFAELLAAAMNTNTGGIDYHSARGRVFYHGDARAGRGRRGDTRELVRTVAQCMWNHIHAYGAAADYGTGHTTAEEDIQGAESYGSVMDGCYDMMLGNKKVPLAYTIELDPIKAAGGAYNPVCNADYRWFSIPENGIQQVFEKNLTAALCLIRYASVGFASKMFHAVRGANGVTVGADTCPFLHGGGGNDMVAKIVNRGNQPPNP